MTIEGSPVISRNSNEGTGRVNTQALKVRTTKNEKRKKQEQSIGIHTHSLLALAHLLVPEQSTKRSNTMWWFRPEVPGLRKVTQENQKFNKTIKNKNKHKSQNMVW